MIILTLRTDRPEAELRLFDDDVPLAEVTWTAHRALTATIHRRLQKLLELAGKELNHIQAIACFQGPGSFTGLRIGLSVANALAHAYDVPIVAEGGKDWEQQAIARLRAGEDDYLALPFYGASAAVTVPKK
jgi:tRNA threonylcarbamoyladenosine biosynthesis protein TsaB